MRIQKGEESITTSYDIARMANVSQATVSRVLSGGTGVSEAKRQRIFAAIAATGYEPDQSAQSLVHQKSRSIALALFQGKEGFSFSSLAHSRYYFYLHILGDIEREIATTGYEFLFPSHTYSDFAHYIRILKARHVAGVLMIAPYPAEERVQAMIKSGIPTVFVDVEGQGEHATYIRVDHSEGSRLAVDHLLQEGHRRIAFLTGEKNTTAATQRFLGYQQALTSAGISVDPRLVRYAGYELDDAYQATRTLLEQNNGTFTAIVAASDMLAFGALQALRERGIGVPEHISIVGSDDLNLNTIVDPPLTTIRPDKTLLAQGSVRLLLEMIEGKDPSPPIIVPAQLITRSSTRSISP